MKPSDSSSSADSPPEKRRQLRNDFKRRRAALGAAERRRACAQIAEHLLHYTTLPTGGTIAAFEATADEVDLSAWMAQYRAAGGVVALPRVGTDGQMEFYEYTVGTVLENNRFGIAEPPVSNAHVPPDRIDAVLAPLVAYDAEGHRLGMGGGYYDRYLPRLRASVPLVGVAFTCQRYEALLPREIWDVPLHAVVTEQGIEEWE